MLEDKTRLHLNTHFCCLHSLVEISMSILLSLKDIFTSQIHAAFCPFNFIPQFRSFSGHKEVSLIDR